jgi:flagellar biosynthesis protein FlhG
MVVCGLYESNRLAALHLRIDEAYDTLLDAERRKSYDQALFPDGLPPRRRTMSTSGTGPLFIGDQRPGAQVAEEAVPVLVPDAQTPTPVPERERKSTAKPLPPEPSVGVSTEFTGSIFKQVREARGIDLHVISQKTKIGVGHLKDIEDERFERMPAVVYVRGFLIEYAKCLRFDVERVLSTYLARYRVARAVLDEERGG